MSPEIQVGLLTAGTALLTVFITQLLQKNNTKEERKQIEFSKLDGLRIWRMQLLLSRTEAYIFTEYYEKRGLITKNPEYYNLAKIHATRSENLALDVARANQQFLECLGRISILFPQKNEIKNLIEENRNFQTPYIVPPNVNTELELEKYKVDALKQVADIMEDDYNIKVRKLIDELRKFL